MQYHSVKGPGECYAVHPWKAKDVKTRLKNLKSDLERIRQQSSGWTPEDYEKESAEWAGKLSETWERMIRQEIIDHIFDQSTQEIRPKLVRLLGRISEDDDRSFQDSYSRIS